MRMKDKSEKNWLKTQHSKNQNHGIQASLVAYLLKNPPAMRETWVQSLGWKEPLEKGVATHSRILAWRIPWCRKESDMTERLSLSLLWHLAPSLHCK